MIFFFNRYEKLIISKTINFFSSYKFYTHLFVILLLLIEPLLVIYSKPLHRLVKPQEINSPIFCMHFNDVIIMLINLFTQSLYYPGHVINCCSISF